MQESFRDSVNERPYLGVPHHGLDYDDYCFFPISSITYGFILKNKMGASRAEVEDGRTFKLVEIIGHDHVSRGYVSWSQLLSVNSWKSGVFKMIEVVRSTAHERKKLYVQTFFKFD